jgi:hypothetical protein
VFNIRRKTPKRWVKVLPGGYNQVTTVQVAALQKIYDLYAVVLAQKQYEQLPKNYVQYAELLTQLKAIQINDPQLRLLIDVAENALVGSVNVGALYTNYAYNEIKVALLNKRIKEILSDKNSKQTASNVSGQFTATQTFTLSPIFSYYIYLYGIPEFGVGFDPVKLAFLRSLPQFMIQGSLDAIGAAAVIA